MRRPKSQSLPEFAKLAQEVLEELFAIDATNRMALDSLRYADGTEVIEKLLPPLLERAERLVDALNARTHDTGEEAPAPITESEVQP